MNKIGEHIMKDPKNTLIISAFFFCLYFGYGAFYPMIGLYLKEQQFVGWEMGIIMSISPLLQMVFQPIWGLITDYTQRTHFFLVMTSLVTAGMVFIIPFLEDFWGVVTFFVLIAVFQSAINPLSDSLVLSYIAKHGKSYGDYRMWGAVSFAFAAWIMGMIGENTSLDFIFYLFGGSLLCVAFWSAWLPRMKIPARQKGQMYHDLKVLFKLPAYLLFIFASFCILGPMLSNNNFFGIFYQFIGGTIAGVGICFLIGVGSEGPFMKIAGSWIRKYGFLPILLAAGALSAVQYFSYALTPPVSWIPWITVLQGFSIGLFIPASLQMISHIAPASVQTTAIAVYNGVAHGIGTWFFIFCGGILLDVFPVTAVYWFFASFTVLGLGFIVIQSFTQR